MLGPGSGDRTHDLSVNSGNPSAVGPSHYSGLEADKNRAGPNPGALAARPSPAWFWAGEPDLHRRFQAPYNPNTTTRFVLPIQLLR